MMYVNKFNFFFPVYTNFLVIIGSLNSFKVLKVLKNSRSK